MLSEQVHSALFGGAEQLFAGEIIFFDGTVGGGGHSEMLLETNEKVRVLAVDRDREALGRARIRLRRFGERVRFGSGNFSQVGEIVLLAEQEGWLRRAHEEGIFTGMLLDLGLSSDQLFAPERGFSFLREGPLDMRMEQDSGGPTARELLNESPYAELRNIFRRGGVGKESGKLASAVLRARPLESTSEFSALCERILRPAMRRKPKPVKGTGRGPQHPATVPFQALRMEVNEELTSLSSFLDQALPLLVPGGRLAIISFHSLEDKIVTQRMRSWSRAPETLRHIGLVGIERGAGKLVTKQAITPSVSEVEQNPRSRSARLRVFERLSERS